MVFDAPLANGNFQARLDIIEQELANRDVKIVKLLEHEVCTGQKHLDKELKKVLAVEGEGLMIKDPNCEYERKRSKKLLKIKVFQDSEAKVLAIEKGQGRMINMMGKILVKDVKTGAEFRIGTGFNDAQRKSPPKVGVIVTYKYQNLTDDGKPRFPVYLRLHSGM